MKNNINKDITQFLNKLKIALKRKTYHGDFDHLSTNDIHELISFLNLAKKDQPKAYKKFMDLDISIRDNLPYNIQNYFSRNYNTPTSL